MTNDLTDNKMINESIEKENTSQSCGDCYELPWIEKYRPTCLEDIVGNTETIERLKVISVNGNMPHIMISGMPGIGKTTSVICLARKMLGNAFKEAVLELNASDERGIDVVRNRIKAFSQKKVNLPQGKHKIIILDEADRYSKLSDQQILQRLLQICKSEDIKYSDDGLSALIFSSEGDMRQAINNLQSTVMGFGFVKGENVFKVVDQPSPGAIKSIIHNCGKGDIRTATEILKDLWNLGYSALDIITTFFKVVKMMDELPEYTRLEYMKEIGTTHMIILEGVQTLLQLYGLLARLTKKNMDPKYFIMD
ncbi:hypothetical protein PCANB_000635 [Pneumocystis canis]|nr:hypothetical protein PCANB_000635 [Pneumocystis canis]